MISIRKRRASDLEFYVNTFIFSVEGHLKKRDYNDVTNYLRTLGDWGEDIIHNQRLMHDFACDQLAPLLAVAVEQKPFLDMLGWLPLERAAISKMYSWIIETVQKYCKKYGSDGYSLRWYAKQFSIYGKPCKDGLGRDCEIFVIKSRKPGGLVKAKKIVLDRQ